jgi:hypothetical protein
MLGAAAIPNAAFAAVASGGLFHCTGVESLLRILKDGYIRPALRTGAPPRGAGAAGRCRKLGGISLFDASPPTSSGQRDESKYAKNWLKVWLRSYRPFAVAIHLDPQKVAALTGSPLRCSECSHLASGLMLLGEVCCTRDIPVRLCALGFLFVHNDGSTVGGFGHSYYFQGSALSESKVRSIAFNLK